MGSERIKAKENELSYLLSLNEKKMSLRTNRWNVRLGAQENMKFSSSYRIREQITPKWTHVRQASELIW